MREKEISRKMVKGDPERTGLGGSRLESSGSDQKTIKLIELCNIYECV